MAEDVFVRTGIIAPKPPPISEIGAIGWMRANLFNGWLNSVLTIVSVLSILFVAYEFLPWMIQSSWTATSLSGCREAITGAHGEGTTGACWAVIRERYLQMLYGFYPAELYWRPNLTFVLMVVALSPILFPGLPRRMLWFSAIYPFLGYWLLWGGTVWFPVSVVLGFVIGYLLIVGIAERANLLAAMICGVLGTVLYWMFLADLVVQVANSILPIGLVEVQSDRFGGFMLSTTIGVTGIACSLPIGILLALGRRSDLLIVKAICVGFIEFIRGVPLITLLFVASTLLNIFLPPGTNFDLILRVVIMVTLFSSAYLAEVVRGGLAALPAGQFEAADALGLDYWKSMRLIVLPQALKISIPGIVSTFIGLFKDTTLVSIIGLLDPVGLTNSIRADAAWNGIVWELYAFVAALFFVFCFLMSRYSMHLERRLQTDRH